MGHDKLRKFAENEGFDCLVQANSRDLISPLGYPHLTEHRLRGRWRSDMFHCSEDAPLVLELGCGKGEYTIGLAERFPESNFLGMDIKGARLWAGAKYVHLKKVPNAAFLRARIEFIRSFFAPGEVSEIWLTFSDPQYRSENSRLSSPMFLDRYRSFLVPGGVVRLKTDSRFLHEYTKAVCRVNSLKVLSCTDDLYAPETRAGLEPVEGSSLFDVRTFYESIFLKQGYKITYISFVIDHEGDYIKPGPDEFDPAYWRSVEGPRVLFGRDTAETRRRKLAEASEL